MKRLLLICVILLAATRAQAEVPKLINYSGKLTDKAGNIVAAGVYDMRFSLWNLATGGTEAWNEEHYIAQGRGVQTYGGGFNVVLGGTTALPAFDQNYWVEVTVTINSTFETFGRQEIISVPYALQVADNSVTGNKIVDNSITGSDLAGDTITFAHILDGTIRSFELQDGAVTQPKAPWAPTVRNGSSSTNANFPKIVFGIDVSSAGSKTIVFPSSYFTVNPIVVCTTAHNGDGHMTRVDTVSLTSANIETLIWNGTMYVQGGDIWFNWIAIGR